ncbi:unnamed protein product, partial [Medioppia subpectinata]
GHVVTESESGDDCIQCPFHGWRFGGDGQCKRIPNLNHSELKAVKAMAIGENGADLYHGNYIHNVIIPYILCLSYTFDESYGPVDYTLQHLGFCLNNSLYNMQSVDSDCVVWANYQRPKRPTMTKKLL